MSEAKTIKSFYEETASMYADYFNEYGKEKAHNFIFSSQIALSVLTSLYNNFIKDGITELGKIPEEKKDIYWATACKYYETMGDRLKASRAAYVLELITSTF